MNSSLLRATCILTAIVTSGAQAAPNEFRPNFTHDGRYLIFHSDRDGDNEIYKMDLRTSTITQLTHNEIDDADAAISPDGTLIAFHSGRHQHESAVYVMTIDGMNLRRVTEAGGRHITPSWSPDGKHLFYQARRQENWRLEAINIDGTGLRTLGDVEGDYLAVSFFDSGRRIVFSFASPGETHDQPLRIYSMNLDGSDLRPFLPAQKGNSNVEFSPDGERVVFNSIRDRNWEIYVMEADGSGQRRLTFDDTPELSFDIPTIDGQPTWSPDGTMIAFISGRDGDFDIYLLNPDTGWLLNLTGFWQ